MSFAHSSYAFLQGCKSDRERTYPHHLVVRLLLPFAHHQVFPSGGFAGNGTFKTYRPGTCPAFFSFNHIYPIGLIWPNLDIWPSPIATQKKGHLGPFSILITMCLAKISAEALYPLACFFEVCIGGCIGNAEIWTKAEGRAVHRCHSFSGQQFADEVFVILNDFA